MSVMYIPEFTLLASHMHVGLAPALDYSTQVIAVISGDSVPLAACEIRLRRWYVTDHDAMKQAKKSPVLGARSGTHTLLLCLLAK
jgi:hypothetical protein